MATKPCIEGFRVLAALLHGTVVVGVSQTAALNRGRHLYSAGRPSRWALAHISSFISFQSVKMLPFSAQFSEPPATSLCGPNTPQKPCLELRSANVFLSIRREDRAVHSTAAES